MSFAVIMAVGPSDREVSRLEDTLESLAHYEGPNVGLVQIVDDGDADRQLGTISSARPGLQVRSIWSGLRLRKGALNVGNIVGLRELLRANVPFDYVLKLDTDALVIAPFAERIAAFTEANPDAGMVGVATRDPNGVVRDLYPWDYWARNLQRPVWRMSGRWFGLPRVKPALWGDAARVRTLVRQAVRLGYRLGEHCQGGAYVLSGELVRRLLQAGILDRPEIWYQPYLAEDAAMGILTCAMGLRVVDMPLDDTPFGVLWRGIPDTPERCVDRNFSFVHSVKNDSRYNEREIRGFFRRRRA